MKRLLSTMILCLLISGCSSNESFLRNRVVKLTGNGRLCSGEQIKAPSGISYVLTAAHCLSTVDALGNVTITKDDGTSLVRKVIAEDSNSDLLLIEGLPNVEGVKIASRSYRGEKVRTFTHGRGHSTYLTDGELLEDRRSRAVIFDITTPEREAYCRKFKKYLVASEMVFGLFPAKFCVINVLETGTTANVQPGSSGGMVVDSSGALVGVVSTGDGVYGGLVRLSDIKAFLAGY